jgi:hypothetical protein
MRDATRLVRSKQILQSYPEEDKPGNKKVTGDKHALAARPGVRCPRSPEPGQRAQGACS